MLVAMLALTSTAHADVRTEARRHFRRGMELVVQGQLDEGVAELEEAYAILPHPNVLFNIARALAEAGRYDDSLDYFDRYLETDPPDRDEVAGFVQALRVRIAERQAAEARATAGAQETGTTTTTGTDAQVITTTAETTVTAATVTDEEIAALNDSAAQFEQLANATGSDTLRRRAERLRELAANLVAARAAQEQVATTTTTATGGGQTTTDTGATTGTGTGETQVGTGLTLGSGQTGLYEEEVVSASRYAQNPLDAPNATTIITRQDIRLSGLTNVAELLRRVAGVQVMNTGSADTNVGIRGFNQMLSPRVLVLLNGRSLYIDPLGMTWYSTLPIGVEDIERIEVIRGPASALYGANGFSGVVNILTRTPGDATEIQAVASGGNANQARAYVSATGRSKGFGYRLSASYQQYDQYQLAQSNGRVGTFYPVTNPNLGYQGATARGHIEYRLTPTTALNVEGGMNYFGQASIAGPNPINNLYGTGSLSYALANLQSSWGGVRVFWNHMEATADILAQESLFNHIGWNTLDVEPTLARSFDTGSVNHNLVLGAAYRLKTIDWNLFDASRQEHHVAAFFQDAIRFSEAFRAVFGVRMDRHPLLDRPVWSPRAAIVVRPTEGQAIRVSGSSAFRMQTMLESYTHSSIRSNTTAVGGVGIGSVLATDLRGVDPLRPERIISAEAGYTNSESEVVTVEFSGYYNRVRDLIALAVDTIPFTLADVADPRFADYASFDRDANIFLYGTASSGNSNAKYDVYGAELGLRLYPADGLDIYVNGTTNLTYRNTDGERSRSRATPLLQVNSGIQYRSRFGLDVASDFSFQTTTIWDEQLTTDTGVIIVPMRLPAYYLLNARVGYRLLNDSLEIGVVGYNITNAHNRQHPLTRQLSTRVMGSVSYRF